MRQPLVVIPGGRDSAIAARKRRAAPALRNWFREARKLVRSVSANKLRSVHIELMHELTNYPSANEFYCYPSETRMADNLGISDRQARRLLVDLKAAGLLSTKRRGWGKTSIWTFCIDGRGLADRTPMSDQDRTPMSDQDRTPMSDQDRTPMSDKPSETTHPFENKPSEKSASATTPSPPPDSLLRAREGEAIAAEVLAKLPAATRVHPVWRGLSSWMAQLLADGAERVDIVVGFEQCLHSLRDRPPNSLTYFSAAIERAREARTRPLPQLAAPKAEQPHQLGKAGDELRKRLGDNGFASWFSHVTLISISGGTVSLQVPSPFHRYQILDRYEAAIIAAFQHIDPSTVRLVISTKQDSPCP
jgi:hypothetical protein